MWPSKSIHCLIFVLSLSYTVRASDPCKTFVPFEMHEGRFLVTQGTIGGLDPLNFLIDTGTSPTLVDNDISQRLGLSLYPTEQQTLVGRANGYSAFLPLLELGPLRAESLPVIVLDLAGFGETLRVRIDALIGLDVLSKRNITIDFKRRRLCFHSPSLSP